MARLVADRYALSDITRAGGMAIVYRAHDLQRDCSAAVKIFEPIWNRHHLASVQISLAESLGVEHRGNFHDGVGALRDVVQNHLLLVLGLIAMEAPAGGVDAIADRKLDVLWVIRDANPREYVRGQYDGYREVEGVKPESDTETFAALGLHIDSWRWSGVPFLIRAGKALRSTGTEVRIVFRQPPPIVQPLLEDPAPVERHPVGSWGPTGAERLAEKHGGWKPPAGGLTGERWAAGGWSG